MDLNDTKFNSIEDFIKIETQLPIAVREMDYLDPNLIDQQVCKDSTFHTKHCRISPFYKHISRCF
jgi:hypothetical protein